MADPIAGARAVVEAVGGDASGPAYLTTDDYSGFIWPSVVIGHSPSGWRIDWGMDGKVAEVVNGAGFSATAAARSATKAEAIARARLIAQQLGIRLSATPDEASLDSNGWSVSWYREAAGYPVDDYTVDGIFVFMNADGTLRQYTRMWRDLTPAPKRPITEEQALAATKSCQPAGKAACVVKGRVWYQSDVSNQLAPLRLGWKILLAKGCGGFIVDAETGRALEQECIHF